MDGIDPPEKTKVQYKVCHAAPICLDVFHAKIMCIHSKLSNMSCVCVHLGFHNHHVSIGMCHESLDIPHQCVANEVSKTPTTKNSSIVIIANKYSLEYHILKSPHLREKNHLHGPYLELVMDKFSTLVSLNYRNFIVGLKRYICSGMGSLDNIMALKNQIGSNMCMIVNFQSNPKMMSLCSRC